MILQRYLQAQSTIIVDGALATEMESRGADLHDSLWSAKYLYEQPELIAAVHRDYLDAGADIIISASYQATIPGFMARGWSHVQAQSMISDAAAIAIHTRDAWWQQHALTTSRLRPLVAGSVGPYGAYTADGGEYRGNYGLSPRTLMDFHRERVALLVAAGVDLLACETIPDLVEACALRDLLVEYPTVPAWISFSCRGTTTCAGQQMRDVAEALRDAPHIVAIGINCSSPHDVLGLVHGLRAHTDKAIVVYPNSGETYDATDNSWHGDAACDAFVQLARTWQHAGASVIGGCCRTNPETIRALRSAFVA